MSDAQAIASKFNRKLGNDTIILASDIRPELAPPRTTGSLGLDVALNGGWPTNKWCELVGEESSGKTALVLKTVAANQAIDPDWFVVWVAAEPFNPEYAEMLGCDLERIAVIDNNIIEEAMQLVIEFLEAQATDCIVIDSLPAMVPDPEAERDMDEWSPGLSARLNNKFFRKARKAIRRSMVEQERPVLCLLINQWREKIGVMYGDSRTTPGGQQKDYEYYIRVEVRRGGWIEDDNKRIYTNRRSDRGKGKGRKAQVGQEMRVRVFKNKTGPPQRTTDIDFFFDDAEVDGVKYRAGDYDLVRDAISAARLYDVIRHRGGGIYVLEGSDREWKGISALEADLRADLALQEEIRDTVLGIVTRKVMPASPETAAQVTEDDAPRRRRRRGRAT